MLLTICSLSAMGQAKKPTLMVVPSDAWCKEHGFEQTFDNQGTSEQIPDYKAAVSSDKQLNAVISKINILMADRGFPLKDLQQNVKSISNLSAEDRLITSKASGAAITESPLDRLRRTAKADIILEIDWTVNTVGPDCLAYIAPVQDQPVVGYGAQFRFNPLFEIEFDGARRCAA